ncbi:hypothetical protein ABZ733_01760 [Streptomyces longwoodensis]|uniref:8-oxoguanine DNA glycosylase OGG fold protein n=1 Tax=Streptomyces longwoodensis TaxID=68231 RepID=UPI0033E6D2AB
MWQQPVRFRPQTWRPRLERHGAARVLDLGVACGNGPSGDRLISRGDLSRLRERAGDDPDSLRYTEAALSDGRRATVLRTTSEAVRKGDLSGA